MKSRTGTKGFTLVEVLIASIIGSFIALVAVGALRAVTAGRELVNTGIETADELRYAVQLIRTDLANIFRDSSSNGIKFVGTSPDSDDSMMTSLTMRVVSLANTRKGLPEGDVHEVQYFLQEDEDKSVLMRRMYPVVGTEAEEELPGGVMTVIAENVAVFQPLYYDGEEWLTEWPAERAAFPRMVRVVVATLEKKDENDTEGRLVTRDILASFPRLPEAVVAKTAEEAAQAAESSDVNAGGAGRNSGSSGGITGRLMQGGGGSSRGPGGRGRGRGDRGPGDSGRGPGGGGDRGSSRFGRGGGGSRDFGRGGGGSRDFGGRGGRGGDRVNRGGSNGRPGGFQSGPTGGSGKRPSGR